MKIEEIEADKYEFWTKGKKYGIVLSREVIRKIFRLCDKNYPLETGGVLIGYYRAAHDCAIITNITKAPKGSSAGGNWFRMGIGNLNKLFERLWKSTSRKYYLGEWHYHPGGEPIPSGVDRKQMLHIASNSSYKCPEPILIIVGGMLPGKNKLKAFVATKKEKVLEFF